MVVLTNACVADSSIHTAANWFAVQVETGGLRPREGQIQHRTTKSVGSTKPVFFVSWELSSANGNRKLEPECVRTRIHANEDLPLRHCMFLDTCTDAGKAKLAVYCADAKGVDRDKVHATVADMAVSFFNRNLR